MTPNTAIILALAAVAGGIIGPLGARVHLLPPMAGVLILLAAGLLGLAALIAAAIAAIRHRAYFHAMVGTLGLLPFLAVLAAVAQGSRYPVINDITTAPEAPPAFVRAGELPENAGRDMAFPEEFAEDIASFYSDLEPLRLDRAPDLAYRHARDMAGQPPFNWTITRDDPDALAFEAVAETRLFRWKDDVAVQVRSDDGGGSVVHMRSKSREGKGDLGANARRIHQFFDVLAN